MLKHKVSCQRIDRSFESGSDIVVSQSHTRVRIGKRPVVAAALPLRPGGVAVADADIWQASAYALVAIDSYPCG
jgi:hypothetical protein